MKDLPSVINIKTKFEFSESIKDAEITVDKTSRIVTIKKDEREFIIPFESIDYVEVLRNENL